MTNSSLYPTHTIICKIPQLSSAIQTQIQPQSPGRISNALQRRTPIGRWVKKKKKKKKIKYKFKNSKFINKNFKFKKKNTKKADIEYPFEHGEVLNDTLDGVSIHPVTTKLQGFLPLICRRGRKLLRDFTMRPTGTLKQLQRLMAVIWIHNIVVTPQY